MPISNDAKNSDGKSLQARIERASFNPCFFIGGPQYLKGDRSHRVVRKANGRKLNI